MTRLAMPKLATSSLALAGTMLAGSAYAQDLTFWTLNFSADAANAALQQVADEFEAANPGVTVEIVGRATDEHKTALRVAAGSDSGPDIYFSWAGLGLGGEYVNAGLSLPMDEYYGQYGWTDLLTPASAAFADLYEGGKHGVPFTFKGEAIYYNRTLFEQAGIEGEPATYEELVAAADKLVEAGVAPITFGGTVNWHVMRLMDVILETKCGAEKHDALMAMQVDWTQEPCAAESFAELGTWSENYILSPFMGIDNTQAFNLFVAGRAAMMLEGDWLVQSLSENANLDEFGIFPFPTGTDRLYGFAEYHYISTKSEHPELAAAFLDYMLSTEVQQELLGKVATTSVNSQVEYTDLRPMDAEWVEIFKNYSAVYMNGDQAFPLDVTTEYFRVINEVASQKLDAAGATQALQTFIDNRS
jgi:raffinose/stachyose/melibiose transport system substrate-binding protein